MDSRFTIEVNISAKIQAKEQPNLIEQSIINTDILPKFNHNSQILAEKLKDYLHGLLVSRGIDRGIDK